MGAGGQAGRVAPEETLSLSSVAHERPVRGGGGPSLPKPRLEAVPCPPPLRRLTWAESYRRYVAFAVERGTAHVPQDWQDPHDGYRLGRWLHNQRQALKRGRLPEEHRLLLDAVPGHSWNTVADRKAARANRGTATDTVPAAVDAASTGASSTPAGDPPVVGQAGVPEPAPARSQPAPPAPVRAQAPPPPPPLRGIPELAAFLRENTEDVLRHLPRHPAHPNLRQVLIELQGSRERLSPGNRAELETIPGWRWKYGSGDHQWWAVYDHLVARCDKAPVHRVATDRAVTPEGVLLLPWLRDQAKAYTAGTLRKDLSRALTTLPGWFVLLEEFRRPVKAKPRVQASRRTSADRDRARR